MDKNTIIETLDYLFEKFGIAVDWTTENVMPYVEQLAEKIVTYNIVSDVIGVIATALAIIGCCIYARVLYGSYKHCKTTEEDTILVEHFTCSVDLSTVGLLTSIIAFTVAVVSTIFLLIGFEDLIKWIFVPELQLIEYVSNLVSNAQV